MKVRNNVNLITTTIDGDVEWVAKNPIILIRHPELDKEGATKGYVDGKLEEFYKNPIINGSIDDLNIIQLKGSEITHDVKGLNLKETLKASLEAVVVDVDSKGRVTKSYPLNADILDPSFKIDIDKVTGRPKTIKGYGIKDVASSEVLETFTMPMTTEKFPKESNAPVPLSFLQQTWEESNYAINVGDIVIKLKGADLTKWVKAHGGYVRREDAPDLVTFLAGEGADEAQLPNNKVRDDYNSVNFSVNGTSYIKAYPFGKSHTKEIPIYPNPR